MFSGFGFRTAVVGVIAIVAVSIGAFLFGGMGSGMVGPMFVDDSRITSSNPFGKDCVMTLKDYSGKTRTINAYNADCFEFPRGTAVYISGDRVYEY